MIGKSLAIRAAAFNNNFPWVHITRSQVCSIYKQNGVKRKALVKVKSLNPKQKSKYAICFEEIRL
jgi:hypothetical protein